MEEKWYEDEQYFVTELSNDINHGVIQLMGIETDNGWLYAIVWWFHRNCEVQKLIKHGKLIYQKEK